MQAQSPTPVHPYPFLQPPVQPDEIGRLGAYRVLELLGQGGMAFVFRAEDIALCRPVALKVMKTSLAGDLDAWQRFVREARIMAAIKHEHLVTIYQAGETDQVGYLAMELLEGETLDAWIERSPQPGVTSILRLAREITGGLAVIHRQGLVHRDIKPANLWVTALDQRVKLLDFGLARVLADDTKLTQSGMIIGTPDFMSPEQARGDPVDARSDLFSLGGVLYRLCTGRKPFLAYNTMAILTALAVSDPRPVHELRPDLPRALSDLIMQLLAKPIAERPPSAEAVLDRLMRIADGESAPAERPSGSQTKREPVDKGNPPKRDPAAPRRERRSATDRLPREPSDKLRRKKKRPPSLLWMKLGVALVLCVAAVYVVMKLLPGPDAAGTTNPADGEEGDKVYLARMSGATREHPFRPPPPPPGQTEEYFREIRVKGEVSEYGIWMFPMPKGGGPLAGAQTSMTFPLARRYKKLHFRVSLPDGAPDVVEPFKFIVHVDGEQKWMSKPVRIQADTQSQTILVDGVNILKLQVAGPDGRGVHAVWVDPYVEK